MVFGSYRCPAFSTRPPCGRAAQLQASRTGLFTPNHAQSRSSDAAATKVPPKQSAPQPPVSPQEESPAAPPASDSTSSSSADAPSRFSLYNWLRFSGLPIRSATAVAAAAVAASDADPEALSSAALELDDAIALVGDGMAAQPVEATVQSPRRRGLPFRRSSSAPSQQSALRDSTSPPFNASHPTLQLLQQRLAAGSKPGARTDTFKLGLVVEGGGMRGCVSAGALMALCDLGMRDAFDAVYGSSAGAINATYFLSGQREGVCIYHDHIAHNEFIDLKRLWSNDPDAAVLNLPYLIDYVMHDVCPLDWDSVVESDIPLKVVASSLDLLQPIILEGFGCKDDLAMCLKASANVPAIAGSYVEHRGHRLVDAAVFEAVPFRSAIADGCTHVLVLCTRPKKERKGMLPPLEAAIETAIKRAILSPEYMVPAWKAEMEYMAKDGLTQDDMLLRSTEDDAHTLPWFAGTHVFPLYPGPPASFSPLCTDVPTLKAGVAEGNRAAMDLARVVLEGVLEEGGGAEEVHESNILPLAGTPLGSFPQNAQGGRGRGRLSRFWAR